VDHVQRQRPDGLLRHLDQYILNILYDPRINAGMTVQEAKAVLPQVMIDVRAWVAKVNDLPLE
jgi:hypothetical protein